MSWVIRILLGVVVLIGALQWTVPQWIGGQISHRIASLDNGSPPHVAVTAMPFWELASGRFQDIYVRATNVTAGPMQIASAQLNWQNGQVGVAALMGGHLAIRKTGKIDIRIRLNEQALANFLATQGKMQHPQVTITPKNVQIKGRMLLGGVYVPMNTTGTLVVSNDRQKLIFHPTVIDGINLPMLTDIQLLDIKTLNLPVPMVIQSVTLHSHYIVVKAGTP